MAMQAGVSLSRIFLLAGAGYTGTILFKNGKLSDLIGELQALVRGLEKSGDADGSENTDLTAQVQRLASEIRRMASSQQITVLNGDSGAKLTSLLVPVAAAGTLGYGYMWWKGISFSDMLWVTRRNMAAAVENLNKHLDSVTDALSAAKKHLTQRIQNLDDKMETQKEISKNIQANVEEARASLFNIEYDLDALQRTISGLDGKLCSLEDKQDKTNRGIMFLCDFAEGKKLPEGYKEQLKLPSSISSSARGLLTQAEAPVLNGLKDLFADPSSTGRFNISGTMAKRQDVVADGSDVPKSLQRTISARC